MNTTTTTTTTSGSSVALFPQRTWTKRPSGAASGVWLDACCGSAGRCWRTGWIWPWLVDDDVLLKALLQKVLFCWRSQHNYIRGFVRIKAESGNLCKNSNFLAVTKILCSVPIQGDRPSIQASWGCSVKHVSNRWIYGVFVLLWIFTIELCFVHKWPPRAPPLTNALLRQEPLENLSHQHFGACAEAGDFGL